MIFDKDVSIVSFLAEFKASVTKYEQNLKTYFEGQIMKNSAPSPSKPVNNRPNSAKPAQNPGPQNSSKASTPVKQGSAAQQRPQSVPNRQNNKATPLQPNPQSIPARPTAQPTISKPQPNKAIPVQPQPNKAIPAQSQPNKAIPVQSQPNKAIPVQPSNNNKAIPVQPANTKAIPMQPNTQPNKAIPVQSQPSNSKAIPMQPKPNSQAIPMQPKPSQNSKAIPVQGQSKPTQNMQNKAIPMQPSVAKSNTVTNSVSKQVNNAIPVGQSMPGRQMVPNNQMKPSNQTKPNSYVSPQKFDSTSKYFVEEEKKQVTGPKSAQKMPHRSMGSDKPLVNNGFNIAMSNVPMNHNQSNSSIATNSVKKGAEGSYRGPGDRANSAKREEAKTATRATPGAMPATKSQVSAPSSVPQSRPPVTLADMVSNVNMLLKTLSSKPRGGEFINLETVFGVNGKTPNDKLFVARATKLKFPSFKQLVLGYMDQFQEKQEIINVNYFLTHTISNPIKYLTLSGGSYASTMRFKAGITKIPKQVTLELYMNSFDIDET